MGKIPLSARLSSEAYDKLDRLAAQSFHKSKNNALEWILRTMDMEKFIRNMAKYHCQQMNHFKGILDTIEESKTPQPVKDVQMSIDMEVEP